MGSKTPDPKSDSKSDSASEADISELAAALADAVITIVPLENSRGRSLVEGGALCERKNGRGVDPNRNWGVHWGHKEKDYDPAGERSGWALGGRAFRRLHSLLFL